MTTRAERAPPPWRKLGAHVSSSEDPSMKGVLVGRPSQMYWDVRTTTDAIVSVAQKQVIQATLTDEEAAGCARKLTKIETLQARIDGAICASYEGRVFQNRYTCADGSERRQFEVIEVRGRHGVTETSGVRCVCCSTDEKPFTWPKMKLDALLRNLRHHAGHTTRRGSKTHLRALFVDSGIPLPRVLLALAHPGKRPGRRGPMPGTLPKKRPRKDPDEAEPTVEYTPRLSAARRRAKRVGKVSELPAVGAIGEDAALLYDVVATAELDAARTPPSTESECDDDDAALLMALKAAPCAS